MKAPEMGGLGIDLARTSLDEHLPEDLVAPDLFRRDVVLGPPVT